MTRVLQLRRGSAAQNNNFTGLAGELTFDTDTKTVRVHDGQTLGGFALARTGENVPSFDISAVSDEFWGALFARFMPPAMRVTSGAAIAISGDSYIECEMEYDGVACFATAHLLCQSPAAGYNIGDVVDAFFVGDDPAPRPNIIVADGAISVRLMTGGAPIYVAHRDSGIRTPIVNENWGIIMRVYG